MSGTVPLGTTYLTDIAKMIIGCDTRRLSDLAILALEIGYDLRHIAWVVRAERQDLVTLLASADGDEAELLACIERADRVAAAQPQTPQAPVVPATPARTRRMPASAASHRHTPPAIGPIEATEVLVWLRSSAADATLATTLLERYRVDQLKIIARGAHLGAMSGMRKDKIIRALIWHTIELPRQHASILEA